eukprot:TRINITY_DN922_c0_g1_i1.p1 TRINITY_DN922_c0_g1~~TRINITY_DN922_c0_g1_i1.p1  ORF type:complete len:115 (+),score=17.12 TRINITY_DN922_c0_g1_i1:219-563(+)
MMRDPKTDPIPAPDPATPTVAAPAPMNLAAESMSALGAEVCMACTAAGRMERIAAMVRRGETARRAMADMMMAGGGYRLINRSCDGETVMEEARQLAEAASDLSCEGATYFRQN